MSPNSHWIMYLCAFMHVYNIYWGLSGTFDKPWLVQIFRLFKSGLKRKWKLKVPHTAVPGIYDLKKKEKKGRAKEVVLNWTVAYFYTAWKQFI